MTLDLLQFLVFCAALMLAAWCAVLDADTIPMIDADTDHLRRLAWADHDRPGAVTQGLTVVPPVRARLVTHAAGGRAGSARAGSSVRLFQYT